MFSSMKYWSVRIQFKLGDCFGVRISQFHHNHINISIGIFIPTHLYDVIKAHESKTFRKWHQEVLLYNI